MSNLENLMSGPIEKIAEMLLSFRIGSYGWSVWIAPDGYVADDYQEALEHTITWLRCPAEGDSAVA